jgi:hypothetical protein
MNAGTGSGQDGFRIGTIAGTTHLWPSPPCRRDTRGCRHRSLAEVQATDDPGSPPTDTPLVRALALHGVPEKSGATLAQPLCREELS